MAELPKADWSYECEQGFSCARARWTNAARYASM